MDQIGNQIENTEELNDKIDLNKDLNEEDNLLMNSYSVDINSVDDSDNSSSVSGSILPNEYGMTVDKEVYLSLIDAVIKGNLEFIDEMIRNINNGNNPEYKEAGPDSIYPIQHAIIYGHVEIIELFLGIGESINHVLEGIPPLHLSLSLAMFESHRQKSINCFSFIFNKLLSTSNNTNTNSQSDMEKYTIDRLGRTILHFITQYDLYDSLVSCPEVLINKEQLFKNDSNGETVIDYICVYNAKRCFRIICDVLGADIVYREIKTRSIRFIERCVLYNSSNVLECLIESIDKNNLVQLKEELQEELINLVNETKDIEDDQHDQNDEMTIPSIAGNTEKKVNPYQRLLNKIINSQSDSESSKAYILKTLVVFHESSYKHAEIKETNLLMRLRRREMQVENPDRLSVLLQPSIGLLHSDFFTSRFDFKECSFPASLADIIRVHDFTYIDSIKKLCEDFKASNKTSIYKYDADTCINQHTWESAVFAAGSVIEAVDRIMSVDCEYSNAICLVRPPGHHAGYFGKVDPEKVGCNSSNGFCFINNVAVGAAYSKYKYRDVIKKVAIVDFDVHHGNGTEEIIRYLQKTSLSIKSENKLCSLSLNKNVCNPWLDYDDSENVLFVSLHAYDEEYPSMFYPSSGSLQDNTSIDSLIYPGGILNVPINKSTKFSHCYRNSFRAKVIPRLIKFKPDIIFISAGFDGHEHETINNSCMSLNEFDYRWMTEELVRIAKVHSKGRVISVLEGGYNINSGVVSSFAQSVMTHTKFLNIALNKNQEPCRIMSKKKRKREFDRELENYKNFKKVRMMPEEEAVVNGNEILQIQTFDKSRLRSTRILNNVKERELEINNDNKPINDINKEILSVTKPMLSVTPPNTPYINYSKSINEITYKEIEQMTMDSGFNQYEQNVDKTNNLYGNQNQNEKDFNLFSLSECVRESEINAEDNYNEKEFIKIHPLGNLDTKENLNIEDNYFVNTLADRESNESIENTNEINETNVINETNKTITFVVEHVEEKEKETQLNIDEEIEFDMDDE